MKIDMNPKFEAYKLEVWYAWFPVVADGHLVWLENVFRGRTDMGLWYYRLP